MKAIQVRSFGPPEVLQIEDVPDPRPGRGQLVIAARAIGVNPVDTYIREGIYGPRAFPWTPGFDAAGVIESVGEGVEHLKPGDSVYTFTSHGTYAEKVLTEAVHAFVMPKEITFSQAACVGIPGATAWRALFHRGGAVAGQTVLIHGATGGVGTAAVQLARAAGLCVIGTGGTDTGRKTIRQLGCHVTLDHRKPDYMKEALAATDGKGFDLILEMLANVNLRADLEVIGKFGRIVVIGSRGPTEIDPRATMGKDADIRGMALFNASDAELRSIHAGLYAAMETGVYTPIVASEIPLGQAAMAHQQVMESHAPGNLVLIPER